MVGFFQSNAVAKNGLSHLFDSSILRHNRLFQFVGHAFEPYAFGFCHSLHGHTRHDRHNFGHLFLGYGLAIVVVAKRPSVVQCLQFLFQSQLHVAVVGGQFVVLVHHGVLLFQLSLVQFLLLFDDGRRHFHMLQMHFCAHFVERINGFVGESPISDIAFCQFDTGAQSVFGVCHVMMTLVPILNVL